MIDSREAERNPEHGPSGQRRVLLWTGAVILAAAVLSLFFVPWGTGGRDRPVRARPTTGTGKPLLETDGPGAPQAGAIERSSARRAAVSAEAAPSSQRHSTGLHGQVVDASSGAGIPLYRLVVRPACPAEEIQRYATSHPGSGIVVRDPEGRFRAPGLEPGRSTLLVEATGYRPTVLDVVVPHAEALAIRLSQGARLRGRVLDRRGQPVARVPVFIDLVDLDDPADPPPQGRVVETDDAGRFRFTRLSPGRYVLSTPRFGENMSPPLAVGSDQQVEEDLRLPFNNTLVIRVQDPQARVLPGAELIITGPAGELRLQTDINGVARRSWLEAGSYLIEARFRGRRSEIRTLDLGDYGRSELSLELAEDGG